MKSNLNYLSQNKQAELSILVSAINEITHCEMIILFGSYARNDWVEEKYNNGTYQYQSDFDVLVVVETKKEFIQSKLEQDIEEKIEQISAIETPVSIIVHDIHFVNRRLSKAQYFFTDIKKEGVILYDSHKYQLSEVKELLPMERKILAENDFKYWFSSAEEFLIDFKNAFNRLSYSTAAFYLHQVVERLYSVILLVFTRYKPNTHDLRLLRKLVNSVDNRFARTFCLVNKENRRLFTLLWKAYVEARYKPSYQITNQELIYLSMQVEELKVIAKALCEEKISSFIKKSSDNL